MFVKPGSGAATRARTTLGVGCALTLFIGLTVLPGCAHRYLIKLTNGDQMTSISKPKEQGGNYRFRDGSGVECVIPTSRVANIETGAVEQKEEKTTTTTPPKKSKHWYLLWLG